VKRFTVPGQARSDASLRSAPAPKEVSNMDRLVASMALALAVAGATVATANPAEDGDANRTAAAPSSDSTAGSSPATTEAPMFVPPNRGAPMARLGGATRSAGADPLPRIEALVPEEPGWTLEEQPVVYWYLAKPTGVRIEFVLVDVDLGEPVVQADLPKPAGAGIQRIALADHGVRLKAGTAYQWLVKLVPNPQDRSYDRVVGGGIERVDPTPKVKEALAQGGSRAHALASAGIWYDAVDELSRQIEAQPDDRSLWNQRAALFEQVGLPQMDLETGAAPGFDRR
jgi:hypothetical protein